MFLSKHQTYYEEELQRIFFLLYKNINLFFYKHLSYKNNFVLIMIVIWSIPIGSSFRLRFMNFLIWHPHYRNVNCSPVYYPMFFRGQPPW